MTQEQNSKTGSRQDTASSNVGGINLLPCPFCGGEAEFERLGDHRASTIVSCTECGCSHESGEEWGHGRRWNTRTAPVSGEGDSIQSSALESLRSPNRFTVNEERRTR